MTKIGLGRPPYVVEALLHVPTAYGFSFDIDVTRGHHYAIYQPGPQGPTEKTNAGDWPQELSYVRQWLGYVKREYEAPDLWAELERQRELVIAPPGAPEDNSPFTPQERELIEQQLSELKELIGQTYALQAGQIRELHTRIDYLVDATARLGRFDWKQVLLSQLISLLLGAIIPQEAFATAIGFVTRSIGHLFGGGGPPELPGGPPSMAQH